MRTTIRTISTAVLMLLVATAAPLVAHAQATHPDFSGSWVLDPKQSDNGQFTPTKLTQKITQTANQLVVDRAQTTPMGESTALLKYALDGTTSENEVNFGAGSAKISTVVTWDGSTAVLTSSFNVQGTDVHSTDRWTLGEGGKTLAISRSINAGGQEMASKIVMVKQP